MDAIDFGPSAKIKMAAIKLLRYMYCLKLYMLVNVISLKPFPQLTSNFKFVFILSRGRTLLILGPYTKNKKAAIKLFKMYAIDTPCERDTFRMVSSIDLKFDL